MCFHLYYFYNEVFKLLNYEYIYCNLHFVEYLCEMWLHNLNMSISQQVVGYHVYQIYTMC